MKHFCTIEIDEIETFIEIDFKLQFGEVEILKVTDLETCCAIVPELPDYIYLELHEMAMDLLADKYC